MLSWKQYITHLVLVLFLVSAKIVPFAFVFTLLPWKTRDESSRSERSESGKQAHLLTGRKILNIKMQFIFDFYIYFQILEYWCETEHLNFLYSIYVKMKNKNQLKDFLISKTCSS